MKPTDPAAAFLRRWKVTILGTVAVAVIVALEVWLLILIINWVRG